MTDAELIQHAKRHIKTDPHLSIFMVRDLETTKAAGLDDLCRAICRHGGGTNDALHVLERLEAYMQGQTP